MNTIRIYKMIYAVNEEGILFCVSSDAPTKFNSALEVTSSNGTEIPIEAGLYEFEILSEEGYVPDLVSVRKLYHSVYSHKREEREYAEYVHHVASGESGPDKMRSICGSSERPFFVDPTHAFLHARQQGRLVVCPECLKVIMNALTNGQDEIYADESQNE